MKDVLLTLTEDHVFLSQLARRVRTMTDRLARSALFDELAKALGGHFGGLEYVVLPAFSQAGSYRLRSEVLIAHMNLKRRLAELLMMERRNARFEAELLRFCDEVEAQADLEQLELLPALRDSLSEADRAFLAAEVEEQMAARLGVHPLLYGPELDEPRGAGDLVREAAVVLGSLPGRSGRY
jgi:hypothetical protein